MRMNNFTFLFQWFRKTIFVLSVLFILLIVIVKVYNVFLFVDFFLEMNEGKFNEYSFAKIEY